MSWVPSPSPRLSANFRDVIPTVLGQVPSSIAGHGRGAQSPMGTLVAPSALSFGMSAGGSPPVVPYQAPGLGPRPQQRQGSFTPAPSAASAVHRGLSPSLAQLGIPARLGSMGNIPYAPPVSNPHREHFQNRSWTPLPNPSFFEGLQRPMDRSLDDKLSHSLTMLPLDMKAPDLLSSPAASPIVDMRMPSSLGGFSAGVAAGSNTTSGSQFSHQAQQRSVSQVPVDIKLNVYYHRPTQVDDNGRAIRKLGGNDLSFWEKAVKDGLGIYHVGIEIHGVEYCFGYYKAPGCRQLGDTNSGVYSHEPRKPGPHCTFKSFEILGTSTRAVGEVEDLCIAFGSSKWTKGSYSKIHHNCVDFARQLSLKLGGGEPPAWCHRGQEMAKFVGLGGAAEEEEDSREHSTSMDYTSLDTDYQPPQLHRQDMLPGSFASPVLDPTGHFFEAQRQSDPMNRDSLLLTSAATLQAANRQAEMEHASRSLNGTYVAPPIMPSNSLAGTYVAPPLSGTYVAPPGPMPMAAAPRAAAETLFADGSRVSVLQQNSTWAPGKIVLQVSAFDDNRYTIMYDHTWDTEANVTANRMVPIPDREEGIPQALFSNDKFSIPSVFQGLASADSILGPLKQQQQQQGKSLGGIAGGIARNINGRPGMPAPAYSSFGQGAPAAAPPVAPSGSYSMGGFGPGAQRAPAPPVSQNFQRVRPMPGSFYPPGAGGPAGYQARPPASQPAVGGGYQAGAYPAPMRQTGGLPQRSNAPAPRGRDTLGSTWRFY